MVSGGSRLNVRVPTYLHRQVRVTSKRLGVTQSRFIREALDRAVADAPRSSPEDLITQARNQREEEIA